MTDRWQAPQETPPPPQPFTGVTLKVERDCNMGCPECFMYVRGNEANRTDRVQMSMEVVNQVGMRIKEQISEYGPPPAGMAVSLHGGEPLLLGRDGIEERAAALRDAIPCDTNFGMQTNGLLLTPKMAEVLAGFNFEVGISLDGNREANDRYRHDQAGRSTFDRVVRAIDVAKAANLKWGLLAVIDLQNDPLETYEALTQYDPPLGMDFLFPLANHSSPPPRDPNNYQSRTPYADWLIPIIDKYINSPIPVRPVKKIRALMSIALGGPSLSEAFGNLPPRQLFVMDDGRYKDVDTLESLGTAAPDLGMNVFEHSFKQVAEHPWMKFRRLGSRSLSPICQKCDLMEKCGGGYIPHRYDQNGGDLITDKFRHPSVYCLDLKKLFRYVQTTIEGYMQAPPSNERGGGSAM